MTESYKLALEFAKAKHKGQKRIGGDDYITHPIAVSEIVKNQGFDEIYQITALFHDLLEDTDATEEEILNGNRASHGAPNGAQPVTDKEIDDSLDKMMEVADMINAENLQAFSKTNLSLAIKNSILSSL